MSFVEVVPIEDKRTETVIKAYLKYVYTDRGGSKFILTDRGGEFSSEAMSYIVDQLGFTKSILHLTHLNQIASLRDDIAFLKPQSEK